jgi:hypothetical protein
MRNGFGGPFKFRPLDKDDAVPMVRKAEAREMRWPPSRYTVQRPDEPDQTGCHEGPTIHFDRPRASRERLREQMMDCAPTRTRSRRLNDKQR